MPLFDQRGQYIHGDQYNAQSMNFGTVQNTGDLITELEKLKEEIVRAKTDGLLDKKNANDAVNQVIQAIDEVNEPKPSKGALLDYLSKAQSLIEGVTTASKLISPIIEATNTIHRLFK